MGLLTQFEKLSEKVVEGLFKGRVGRHIQPVEIAKKLAREMAASKTISVSKVYVPNKYEVRLSQEDWNVLTPVENNIAVEMEQYLIQKAAEKEYYLVAKPEVSFLLDENLLVGNFEVSCCMTESGSEEKNDSEGKPKVDHAQPEESMQHTQVFSTKEELRELLIQPEKRAELIVILGNDLGMTFRLKAGTNFLGRRDTNQIFLDDANVSRCHAQIDQKDGGFFITDLQSLNGTFVNGESIRTRQLIAGDHIRVGTTELEFRVV